MIYKIIEFFQRFMQLLNQKRLQLLVIFYRVFKFSQTNMQKVIHKRLHIFDVPNPPKPKDDPIEWLESDNVYKPIEKSIHEFLTVRGIDTDKFSQVYILETAYTSLTEHLKADTRVENGGILFGNAYTDFEHGIYVEITAAVAAPATIGTGVYLKFTAESWLRIMDSVKAAHTDVNIVGWYHSHPNIGVFMSETDMRTQQAFFYHPWSLSIVYDPVRNQIGYFLGHTAKLVEPILVFGLNSD